MTVRLSGPLEVAGLFEVLWGDAVVLREPPKWRAAATQALDADLHTASPTPRPATGTAAAAEQENLFHDSEPQQKNSRPGYCFV